MSPEFEAVFASPMGAMLIFCLRIVDVSCDTMRVLFAVRGKRLFAGFLGFFQAMIWIFAVGTAIKYLDSWYHILGYAGGYAVGTYVGITIEQAVAFGLNMVRIVSQHSGVEIVHSVVQRAHLEDVMRIVDGFDRNAMVTVEEPKVLRGGSVAARNWRVSPSWMRWGGGRRQRV